MENNLEKYYFGQNGHNHAYYLASEVDTELTRLRGEVERQEVEKKVQWENCITFKSIADRETLRAETAEKDFKGILVELETLKRTFYASTEALKKMGKRAETAEAQLAELQSRKSLSVEEIDALLATLKDCCGVNLDLALIHERKQVAQAIHSALPPDQGELIRELVKAVAQAGLWFTEYAQMHYEKGNIEKGDSNGDKATAMKQAIAKARSMGYE